MLARDILKKIIFECEIKKYSSRTIKGYVNNNATLRNFIKYVDSLGLEIKIEKKSSKEGYSKV